MIEEVTSFDLPVNERFRILKNRITGTAVSTAKKDQAKETGQEKKRISIVTGIHGDELEGQYVCYKLVKLLNENLDKLDGIVDVYPAMNPLGIDSITRGIPFFDLDMNRLFPGSADGSMTEYVASQIIENLDGSDLVVDIHASNMYLMEMPQIRINEISREQLLPLAKLLNVDFVWVHEAATVLEATLAYSLNSIDVPTLVVEMGIGMRVTKSYGDQLLDGILNVMAEMGMWKGERPEVRKPIVADIGDEVDFYNAAAGGIFIPEAQVFQYVHEGDIIGNVVSPAEGKVLSEIRAAGDGLVFTIRKFPVVNEGSLLGRVLRGVEA
ncbi:MAG: succinylglutamate desuccinylase [Clostridia bacterium]|nr:succinylglutamate desuccinylase [Clostridia bacterium]NCC43443.1 succinylglutamate desuccinylase [Clostridia bacterium]